MKTINVGEGRVGDRQLNFLVNRYFRLEPVGGCYRVTPEEKVKINAKTQGLLSECIQLPDSAVPWFLQTENRGIPARMEPRAADESRLPAISSTSSVYIPHRQSNIIQSIQKLHIALQLLAFQKRFRLLDLPLAEIRPEFDRNTDTLQLGMPGRPRCQGFHR